MCFECVYSVSAHSHAAMQVSSRIRPRRSSTGVGPKPLENENAIRGLYRCVFVCVFVCVLCQFGCYCAYAYNNVTHFIFSLRCVTPAKFNAVKKEPGVEHDQQPNQERSGSVKTQRKPLLLQQSNALQLQQREHLRAALQESEPGADGHEDECHKCRKR